MRQNYFFILLVFSYFSVNAQTNTIKKLTDNVSEKSLRGNIFRIAGNEFEGRMAASKGDNLAVKFIANWFTANHLTNPYQTTTPFLQYVPLVRRNYSKSSLTIDGKSFELNKEWTYGDGSNDYVSSLTEVVYIGNGISVPSFDELKDIDIEGKYVILQLGLPIDSKGNNLIPEKEMPNQGQILMDILSKKPSGILLYSSDFSGQMKQINDARLFQPYHTYTQDEMPPFNGYLISSSVANYLVGNIDSVNNLVKISAKPNSFNTHKKISISIKYREEKINTSNIVGILKGTNDKLPCIVFTAHHDHEGKVNGSTYYGADDNGSGTAALLEIVKVLGNAASKGVRPKRTIVFVSTAAEEQGLNGSQFYVEHPAIKLAKTYCNINIDMLGRVDSFYAGKRADSNYIYCLYNDTTNKIFNSEKLHKINQSSSRFILDTLYDSECRTINSYSLITRSDHFPFIQKGVPALWLFSGFHQDYHQPSDTPDKINFPLFKRRTQFALSILWQLANE